MDATYKLSREHPFRFFHPLKPSPNHLPLIDDYQRITLVPLDEALQPLSDFIPYLKSMVASVQKKQSSMAVDPLSIDESASIMLYTLEWTPAENSFYYVMNEALQSSDHYCLTPWFPYLKLLHIALTKLPPMSIRILYRAMRGVVDESYEVGERFNWDGYVSCTLGMECLGRDELNFAEKDARMLFIIHTNQGKDVTPYSLYRATNEIILPPDQHYQVVSCRQSKKGLRVVIIKEMSLVVSLPALEAQFQQRNSFENVLRKLVKKCKLDSEVDLRGFGLTDGHMEAIARVVLVEHQCSWLSLRDNQITSQGLSNLVDCLETNVAVESLHLSNNLLNDVQIEHWAERLFKRCPQLAVLRLDGNSIGNEGAEVLAKLLRNDASLTDLWLSNNTIGDRGMQALARTLRADNQTLLGLYLDGNPLITSDSAYCLKLILLCNESLEIIDLRKCSLSSATNALLKQISERKQNF